MSFSSMMEILQEKEKNKIVFVNTGAFYIATGRDAVFLHEEIGLKLTCLKKQVCKVGFPETALEKYVKLLKEKNISYIVYKYESNKTELRKISEYIGKYHKETKNRNNCILCKGINTYRNDKYIEALTKLYE